MAKFEIDACVVWQVFTEVIVGTALLTSIPDVMGRLKSLGLIRNLGFERVAVGIATATVPPKPSLDSIWRRTRT